MRRHDDAPDFDPASVRANESLDLTVGSKRLRITGGATILILLLAAALGYVIWSGTRSTAALTDSLEKRSGEHQTIMNELKQAREENSYILTLDQAHRDQLRDRLKVPERFR